MAAATDKPYRSQRALDIVFAVSCILMLVSVVWMFAQDQNREWKVEQRVFRDVEEALAQRAVVRASPDKAQMTQVRTATEAVAAARKKVEDAKQQVEPKVKEVLPKKVKSEDKFQAIKAELDSKISLYDIAVDERNRAADPSHFEGLGAHVASLRKEVDDLREKLRQTQNEVDANKVELAAAMKPVTDAEQELSNAEDKLKELVGAFDRFHKLAEQKRWGAGDWFRSLPVLDAFASPIRIQQTTLNELPINYSFKYVTRYDRCATCHLGIDRASFSRQALVELGQDPSKDLQQKLQDAKESLDVRRQIMGASGGLNPNDIQLKTLKLTDQQVTEFCAHPRLDLFVDGNSPHPSESFGCTICHGGQGSATSFLKASHSPNGIDQKKEWEENPKLNWEHDEFWDYPMLPKRFVESACMKCHHQMTDLIREGSQVEAPKLMRGYNLVRENGCFGCHEIAGTKGGRSIGPDLRLEPTPPLDAYTPAEKVKLLADTLNPPGTMRKVGPSLRRISEKTNAEWMRLWLKSPRTFRPDTKMPHFYQLSNNLPDVLKGTGQEQFPDAEINAIVTYLLEESSAYLKGSDKFRLATQARLRELQSKNPGLRTDKENQEIEELKRRLELFAVPTPLAKLLPNLPEEATEGKAKEEQLKHGRQLFTERGCLACHINEATTQPGNGLPAVSGDAHFGPNLSRIAAKLGTGTKDSARRWLVQWVMNPTIYHPRTAMPITHLSLNEANDLAAWLLNQKTDWPQADEKKLATETLAQPKTETLKELAKVFLVRAYSHRQTEEYLKTGFPDKDLKGMKLDQDERELAAPLDDHKLKRYIGKKAINQLGCFGCHDVPGFEYAKPIGTPLNDWGKKDAERLAFEDAAAYVRKHHYFVDNFTGKNGKPVGVNKEGKLPYDQFFYKALDHHEREGFLNQKLTEPRSYDYDRMRAWDDRLRMPQFRFARAERRPNENEAEFQARALKEEAEARESVMTFILGLIAEPVPPKYVYRAPPDRQAEIKGRQVLDKFNCAGCHLVRSGTFDVKLTPLTRDLLGYAHGNAKSTMAPDHSFADHNAWAGTNPLAGDRITLHGVDAKLVPADDLRGFLETDYNIKLPADLTHLVQLRLTDAARFQSEIGGKKETRDIPAASTVLLPVRDLLSPRPDQLAAAPFGGTLANLLVPYLAKANPQKYPFNTGSDSESDKARPAVPPPLLREGEKTQPDWLFRFLRNPHEIRPMTVLRMPKFNMSDEDAMALVNYFAGADRTSNPALGLSYPYFKVPERDESYLEKKTAEYVDRLKKEKRFDAKLKEMEPFWDRQAKDFTEQLDGLKKKHEEARKEADDAKDGESKEKDKDKLKELTAKREKADQTVAALALQLRDLEAKKPGMDVKAMRKEWEEKQVYAIDAYRLVVNDTLCLGCHQVGSVQPKEKQGPNLDLAWQRLRPRWTERWLANPQRLLSYPTPMPQNFPRGAVQYQDYFHGSSREQATAARDFLMMYPKVVDLPAIRNRPVGVPGGKQ